jgi:hypothetical protein
MGDKILFRRGNISGFSWDTFTPSGDSRIVYCDSTMADDSGNGLTPETAKKTLDAAGALIRTGYPDWLLLKCGCTWSNQTLAQIAGKSGRSNTERIVVSTYGSGARPIVDTVDSTAITSNSKSNLCIEGIRLYATKRDPNHANWDPACSQDSFGLNIGWFSNLTIQDCDIGWYAYAALFQGGCTNVHLLGNFIHDIWTKESYQHCSGIYSNGLTSSTIEGNIFDTCGWSPDAYAEDPTLGEATGYNHGMYLENPHIVTVKNNVIMNSSSMAMKLRCDTHDGSESVTIEDNLFLMNGITVGITTEGAPAITWAFRDYIQRRNLHCKGGAHPVKGGYEAWGSDATGVKNLEVTEEIFFDKPPATEPSSTNRAWFLCGDSSPTYTTYAENVHVHHCIVQDWTSTTPKIANLYSDPAINIVIEDNDIEQADSYWVDTERTVATYNGTVGGAATYADYIARCRAQRRSSWDCRLEARNVYTYIKAGFTPV